MKKELLLLCLVLQTLGVLPGFGQALNPNDPIVVYNPNTPPQQPPNGQIGKWVITPWANWDTYSYKAYIYKDLPFRIKFPKDFNAADSKKYPLILMLHGEGEKASNLYNNELQLKWGAKDHRDAIDNGTFDGFAIFPQNQTGAWSTGQLARVSELIQLLINQAKIDPDRISVHGLSVGGQGVWNIISMYPKLFACGIPMSAAKSKFLDGLNQYIYMPLWLSQGGKDANPAPSAAEYLVNKITGAGGSIRYSFYPNNSHNTWQAMYAEPDFFPFMIRAHKTNPHVFYGKTTFCPGETINVKLGLTQGFEAYEWSKDGSTITSATTNEITVTQAGSYAGRFKRNGVWSSWSLVPVVIKYSSPEIPVQVIGSTALPTPAGQTSVTLKAPDGGSYLWSNGATTQSITVTAAGSYYVSFTSPGPCGSGQSNPIVVTVADGPGSPAGPSNFGALITSSTQVKLSWQDNANNEMSYEIYNSTDQNAGFQFLTSLPANTTSYQHTVTSTGFTHYYKLRCINNSGGSGVVSTASATTLNDTEAPSIPQNLLATSTGTSGISLSWNPSTDNKAVTGYDVFQNGTKITTVTGTTYSPAGLTKGQLYYFHVRARDAASNTSAKSNQSVAYAGTGFGTPVGPAAPANLAATASSYEQINLTWQDKSNNENGFEIYRSLSSGGAYVFLGKVNSNITSYSSLGLAANTTYYYKVRAINNNGESAFTAVASATTQPLTGAPTAPTNLTASVTTKNSVKLSWTDNANNETGFKVKRATAAELPNYTQIAQLGSNITVYDNTSLQPHTEYFYQVVAYNVGGESTPLSKSFTTSNTAPVLAAIGNKVVDFGVKYEIKVTSTDADGDALSYSVTNLPGFVSFKDQGGGIMSLIINAGANNTGVYSNLQIKVSDNFGGSSTETISISVNSLTAIGNSKTSVALQWADRQGETGYQIERRLIGGTFSQVGTTNADITDYIDNGLSQNTAYEYRIRGIGSSAVTSYSNIATTSTLNYLVHLNFNQNNPAASPWNNANRVPQLADVFSSLLNDNGQNSGLSVTITKNFDGENPSGINTGNNSGVVPDNVMRSTYWLDASNSGQLKVNGLKQTERYNFVFFASRIDNGQNTNRTTDYVVNGSSVSLNASDNFSKVVKLSNMAPNAQGEIIIDVLPGTNSLFGYIGGLIIHSYSTPATTARIAFNNETSKVSGETEMYNEINSTQVITGSVFPNPFSDHLFIQPGEKFGGNVNITLRNSIGNVVLNQQVQLDNINNIVEIKDLNISKGIYFLTITNANGDLFNQRILKE